MRAHVIDEEGTIINTVTVPTLMDGMIDADFWGGAIGDAIINDRLVPKSRPTPEAQFLVSRTAYMDSVRTMREQVLIRINGYVGQLWLKEPPVMAEEKALCNTIIQALLDITVIEGVVSATSMPALKTAVKAEYARLVNLASDELKKAFRKVDL